MSSSNDTFGHHGSESMTLGTPTSPMSPHQSQYLPSYLLGDSMSHSPVSSRLWSGSGGSPPRSAHRHGGLTSPNASSLHHSALGTPRLDSSLRTKDRVGGPPTKSLLQSASPNQSMSNSPFSTPAQFSRTASLNTPAPPTTGLSQSLHESMYTPEQTHTTNSRVPVSPAQLDPFYTQGESLTTDDVLDDTWITVFGCFKHQGFWKVSVLAFPPSAASFVLQHFSQYGSILKHNISTDGNWMHIHYQSKIQAKKALSKNGKILGNSIMVGVTPCIDKKVMDINNKENDSLNSSSAMFGTPAGNSNATFSNNLKYTPIRPLVAAHRAAKNEHEVVQNSNAPKKSNGFVSKAMEYMFGW